MNAHNEIMHLTIIAGRKNKDELLGLLSGGGGHLIDVSYGRGAYKSNYLKDVLGLTPEECKIVITCIISESKADEVIKKLEEEHNFNERNTGIAFTVPVEKLSF